MNALERQRARDRAADAIALREDLCCDKIGANAFTRPACRDGLTTTERHRQRRQARRAATSR